MAGRRGCQGRVIGTHPPPGGGGQLWLSCAALFALALGACARDPGTIPGCRTSGDCTHGEVCIAKTGVCERFNRPLDIDASVRDGARVDAAMRMDAPRRDASRSGGDGPRSDGPPADAARVDARPRG